MSSLLRKCFVLSVSKARASTTFPQVHRLYTVGPGFSLAATATRDVHSMNREGEAMGSVIEVCTMCEGTGWKRVSGNPRVTRCDCRVQARAQRLLQLARIPKRYEHCELS